MGMIFKFRALSDENDDFVRDYELRYDSDLAEFHRLICSDLGFDPGELCSFFISGQAWEKGPEFTSIDIGAAGAGDLPLPMEGQRLSTVVKKERQRLIYTFDPLSARSLYIELTGTCKEEEGAGYPRISHSAGSAPAQFDLGDLAETGSIFDEALGEFAAFEGDELYDDDF